MSDLVRQGIAAPVLDNRSTDGTISALEPFVQSGLVHIESFPSDVSDSDDGGRFAWTQILSRK